MESDIRGFEKRKADHIRLSLDANVEAKGGSGFDRIRLIHEALPEINFSDIQLNDTVLGRPVRVPLMVSGMTAGHGDALDLNRRLAKACARRGWWMGVGSQRRQLFDEAARVEWLKLRNEVPEANLLGNLGLSQAIHTSTDKVLELAHSIDAVAMVIHTNPLQESLQPEGTPQFKGGLDSLRMLSQGLPIPLVLKETGCGVSALTFKKLRESGLAAVDVSGFGGTHWGRIEGARALEGDLRREASQTFADWGISTVESLLHAQDAHVAFEVWASGGVRSGLDAAKAIALGARMVGFAKPALEAALKGDSALDGWMEQMEFELKTALFCTGSLNLNELRDRQVLRWQKT